MKPITVNGKRIPCGWCRTHYAQYEYHYRDYVIPICDNCSIWLWAMNGRALNDGKYHRPDHCDEIHIRPDVKWDESTECGNRIYWTEKWGTHHLVGSDGKRYYRDLADIFEVEELPFYDIEE